MSQLGHNRERQWVHRRREQGFWAMRAPGSLGVDVVSAAASIEHDGMSVLYFDEVKATAAGPFHSFGPEERRALALAAAKAGATPRLVWWPARSQPQVFAVEDWPAAKEKAA